VLALYNSLTRTKESFASQRPDLVRVYHCGPTVYKRPHLGNMRRFLFADFLHRSLEFFGYTVQEITNITDVGHLTADDLDAGEDKLEREARQQHLTPQVIAERVTEQFFSDLAALAIARSNEYPRATDHIPEMQELIARLIARGHAYQTASGVYFDVTSFPAYGQLSGNTLQSLATGARVDVREDKRHPADFALWKIADATHLQQWDSPWGRGYPGWHIECSAMAMAYLSSPIDIHTGGEDLKFPHHENEIAQAEGATGEAFARFWLHNGMLQMAGAKLAKREGKQLTVDTLREHGYSPLAFRLLAFGSHYRSPMEFSWEAMDQAAANLETLKSLVRRLQEAYPTMPQTPSNSPPPAGGAGGVLSNTSSIKDVDPSAAQLNAPLDKGGLGGVREQGGVVQRFAAALADDLNTPVALATVLEYAHELNTKLSAGLSSREAGEAWATLQRIDSVLGVLEHLAAEHAAAPEEVQGLAQEREAARARGDFAEADAIRARIEEAGWRVEDTPSGPRLVPA